MTSASWWVDHWVGVLLLVVCLVGGVAVYGLRAGFLVAASANAGWLLHPLTTGHIDGREGTDGR